MTDMLHGLLSSSFGGGRFLFHRIFFIIKSNMLVIKSMVSFCIIFPSFSKLLYVYWRSIYINYAVRAVYSLHIFLYDIILRTYVSCFAKLYAKTCYTHAYFYLT